jgi:hypothetical protein
LAKIDFAIAAREATVEISFRWRRWRSVRFWDWVRLAKSEYREQTEWNQQLRRQFA